MDSVAPTPTQGVSLYRSLPPEQRQQLIVDRFKALGNQAAVAAEIGCSESVVSRQLDKANVVREKQAAPSDGTSAPLDMELTAQRRIEEALSPLSVPQRTRVLRSATERTAELRKASKS